MTEAGESWEREELEELNDLARALDVKCENDLEYWRSHYHAAMLNWTVALGTIDALRASLESVCVALEDELCQRDCDHNGPHTEECYIDSPELAAAELLRKK